MKKKGKRKTCPNQANPKAQPSRSLRLQVHLVYLCNMNDLATPRHANVPFRRTMQSDRHPRPLRRGTQHDRQKSRLEDVVIHRGVTVRGSSRSSARCGSGAILSVVVGDEVVGHLGVELLSSLLRWAAVATAARLVPGRLAGSASLGSVSTVLVRGSRLGLSLGLTA